MITIKAAKKITGTRTYLLRYEEAYILATSGMDGAHGLPRYTISLTNELQQVLYDIGKKIIVNVIRHNYEKRYAHRVI